MNKALKLEWLGLVTFTLFAVPAFAQSIGPQAPSHPPEESVQSSHKPIQADVSLVVVNVTVTGDSRLQFSRDSDVRTRHTYIKGRRKKTGRTNKTARNSKE